MTTVNAKSINIKNIGLPLYSGLETAHEDLVYAYLREAFSQRGYSLRVKRSGCVEIDNTIRSTKNAKHGRGSCDAYVFSESRVDGFYGLIELESSGELAKGISQVTGYAKSFTARTLDPSLVDSVKKIQQRNIILVVFDGGLLWIATYSLDSKTISVIVDKESVRDDRKGLTRKLFSYFPDKTGERQRIDEKALVKNVAELIRGKEKFQKNKALVMTILASIFGTTGNRTFPDAVQRLKKSQEQYDIKIYEAYCGLLKELGENCETLLETLYNETAADLSELSQDRGMDLYGFIYEELSTRDTKKEQGEYYTPRHTIRPIISAVMREYLKWDEKELSEKVVFDPYCGSGGMLYEYIHCLKTKFDLSKETIDEIAEKSIFGVDKASILSAYLNLYLIGDGSANLRTISTTINWRREPFLHVRKKGKSSISVFPFDGNIKDEKKQALEKVKTRIENLNFMLGLYGHVDGKVTSQRLIDSFFKCENFPVEAVVTGGEMRAGKVDLLLTNVPYGKKISDPLEKCFGSSSEPFPFGGTLEANALKECIDFLRPAKMEERTVVEKGGLAVVIVPDSILENPSTKAIRDYMIERCDILAIVCLPRFTFSPYSVEKTYAIVFRKIAPEQFDSKRELSSIKTFMYYSISDGKANSVNRFPTKRMHEVEIKVPGSKKPRKVIEYIHNDFDPCFDRYSDDSSYLSKLERAWNGASILNEEWDQQRVTDQWSPEGWVVEPGRKWGFFALERERREYLVEVVSKSLANKIFELINTDMPEISEDTEIDLDLIGPKLKLNQSEREKFESLSSVEIFFDDENRNLSIRLLKIELVEDIVLNPDASRYLGPTLKKRLFSNVFYDIKKMDENGALSTDNIVEYFNSEFKYDGFPTFKLSEFCDVVQGTQFSKEDSYNNPGFIPVFTAATNGPAFYCDKNIPGKVKIDGPALIWSRKGFRAGTIQLFDPSNQDEMACFISDVSGAIKAKTGHEYSDIDLTFLRYYLAGQVKSQIQSKDNNAQLNKSKLESLTLAIPGNHKEIGGFLRLRGL